MLIRILVVFSLFCYQILGYAKNINGFDLNNMTIPETQVFSGGPDKDGIPAIDKPIFVKANAQHTVLDSDLILGITHKGIAKAYPISILNWHEIVNDKIANKPVVVTFCPLCGSGMAFDAMVNNKPLTFGVSGLLYNSDVLLYDRESESLWSQLMSQSVSGKYKHTPLNALNVQHTTWSHWQSQHPSTLVLTTKTGYSRNYNSDPYKGYSKSKQTYFPVKFKAAGYHPKEKVIGLTLNGKSKAWPFVELKKTSIIKDKIGDKNILVKYDTKHKSARIFDEKGAELSTVTLFWFAWAAFHPDTDIYKK